MNILFDTKNKTRMTVLKVMSSTSRCRVSGDYVHICYKYELRRGRASTVTTFFFTSNIMCKYKQTKVHMCTWKGDSITLILLYLLTTQQISWNSVLIFGFGATHIFSVAPTWAPIKRCMEAPLLWFTVTRSWM